MKKWLIPVIVIAIIGFWAFSKATGFYNTAVIKKEEATGQWSKVESAYQRRADLIPNLVATVKGYAEHEKSTLEAVIKARAAATQTKIDPSNITPEQLAKFQQAQQGLSGALSRLLVTVEKYPELKANQNFLELQSQLEGTENRIKVERDRFNDKVKDYNKYIKVFPNNFFAKWFGMKEMGYFKADAGSEKAPKVQF
ncbi:MAG TPA: LemA family protein [Flavobacteriia bacterium]|nr:LemA family protein [Flavobacteriia bacterium]